MSYSCSNDEVINHEKVFNRHRENKKYSCSIHGKVVELKYKHTLAKVVEDKVSAYYSVPVYISDMYDLVINGTVMLSRFGLNNWGTKVITSPIRDKATDSFIINRAKPQNNLYQVAEFMNDGNPTSRHLVDIKAKLTNKVTSITDEDYQFKSTVELAHSIGMRLQNVKLGDDHELIYRDNYIYSNCRGVGYRFAGILYDEHSEPTEATLGYVKEMLHTYIMGCVSCYDSSVTSEEASTAIKISEVLSEVGYMFETSADGAYKYAHDVCFITDLFQDDYSEDDIYKMLEGEPYLTGEE